MNTTWYENEIVRIHCSVCDHIFQTRMKVNGSTKEEKCTQCRKIISEVVQKEGEEYTAYMNRYFDECIKTRRGY